MNFLKKFLKVKLLQGPPLHICVDEGRKMMKIAPTMREDPIKMEPKKRVIEGVKEI